MSKKLKKLEIALRKDSGRTLTTSESGENGDGYGDGGHSDGSTSSEKE
jgi:hypothetical protein